MKKLLRVLIVDDDPHMSTTLQDILTASGYEVETAGGAEEGLSRLERGAFDCVISDIRMPGMNGVRFQQAAVSKHGKVPFLFITAYAENELYKQAREQGAIGFLEKPLDLPLLLTVMKVLSTDGMNSVSSIRKLPLWSL